MYYKIPRDSDTGKKLLELEDRGIAAHNATKDLITKYCGSRWRGYSFPAPGLFGGASEVEFESKEDIPPFFKETKLRRGLWSAKPRRSHPTGLALIKALAQITQVSKGETLSLLGVKVAGGLRGFIIPDAGHIYIHTAIRVSVPKDCIEVMGSEYIKARDLSQK